MTGGIDLSVGRSPGLSGMVAGYVLTQGVAFGGAVHYPHVALAVVLRSLALLVGRRSMDGW